MSSDRNVEREGLAARIRHPESLQIEHEIENTLSQMRGTLNEIQEKISPERFLAPLKTFLLSPAGKTLLALCAITLIRRKPLLSTAAALGAVLINSRRKKKQGSV